MNVKLEQRNCGSILQYHINPNDPETFVAGELIEVFEDSFLIRSISPFGQWDGFALYSMSDLLAVEKGTLYLQYLVRLLTLRNQLPPPPPQRKKNGLETVLTYAQDNQRVVALELNKSGERNVIGYVTEQSESCICIRQLSEFGQWDGSSYVKSSAVTRVYIGDTDTTCLELLSAQDIGQ